MGCRGDAGTRLKVRMLADEEALGGADVKKLRCVWEGLVP